VYSKRSRCCDIFALQQPVHQTRRKRVASTSGVHDDRFDGRDDNLCIRAVRGDALRAAGD
jgi:hypothetical protein